MSDAEESQVQEQHLDDRGGAEESSHQSPDPEESELRNGTSEAGDKSRSQPTSPKAPRADVVPETPLPRQISSSKKKVKLQVVRVNADDGRTMEDHIADLINVVLH